MVNTIWKFAAPLNIASSWMELYVYYIILISMMSVWNSLAFNSFCWRMCSNGSGNVSTHLPSPCSGRTQARLLAAPGSWFTCVTEVWTPHHTASCWTRYCPATIFCKIDVGQDVQRSLHVCTILGPKWGSWCTCSVEIPFSIKTMFNLSCISRPEKIGQ